jgi:hypothetical protein
MRSKWFRRIKRFIEQFTPGGTEYTSLGTEIHFSSKGAITVPRSEYKKILLARLGEFRNPNAPAHTDSEHTNPSRG